MKKILILGAGVYQVKLIETAKQMGLYTIVSSIPGDYPGFAHADKVYYVNTTDKEKILEIARAEKVSAIVTTGTDVAVSTVGYVNNQMGLCGINEEAAYKTTDKKLMKEAFRKGGVGGSDFVSCVSLAEAYEAVEKIGLPVVVKCVDSSGSRGISLVEDIEELEKAFHLAKKYSKREYILIEEKMEGREIGVDGIVVNGEAIMVAPHNKFTYQIDNITIPAGHAFPYNCSPKVNEEIDRQLRKAVKALGIDNTAFNSDVFVNGDTVKVIEVGGRAGATCIPDLMSTYYGLDFYKVIIQLALGEFEELNLASGRTACMSKLLMSPADGVITDIKADELKALNSGRVRIELDYKKGQQVSAMKNGTNRIGHVICESEQEAEIDEILRKVYELIYIDGRALSELW